MLREIHQEFFTLNKYFLFSFIIVTSILVLYINQHIIINEDHYVQFYGDQLPLEQITQLINVQNRWMVFAYLFIPVYYLIRFSVITLWFLTGIILFGYNISFKKIFGVILIAELIWLIPPLFKIAWFGFIQREYSLPDLQVFQPFSLLQLFDVSHMESWMIFTLKSANVYLVFYVLVVATGMEKLLKINYSTSLKYTTRIYLTGWVLWVVIIDFLSISMTL